MTKLVIKFVRFSPSTFHAVERREVEVTRLQDEEGVKYTEITCHWCGQKEKRVGWINSTSRRECYECRDMG
jgi:hypothetical protein